MSSAPTPAPHTPANYLQGGGSSFFSENCQQLLINANLNPDWFGSYSKVDRLCDSARGKCDRWNSATDAERAQGFTLGSGTPPKQVPLERPTAGDHYLASCQSGHLVRDSNFREGGKSTDGLARDARGDPCRNLVDGYTEGLAPAVPQQGAAADPTGEHGLHTRRENADARRRRVANTTNGLPRTNYTEAERHQDEDNRTGPYLNDHQEKWRAAEERAANQPPGAGATAGAGAGGSAGSAGGPGGAQGSGLGKATTPTCPPADVVDGNDAASCINNWRKKAEAQMKSEIAASTDKNLEKSTPPANFPGKKTPPPSHQEQYQAHLDQQVLTARANHEAAKGTPDEEDTRSALTEASSDANRFRSAGCLAEQGARLRGDAGAGPLRTDGRAR